MRVVLSVLLLLLPVVRSELFKNEEDDKVAIRFQPRNEDDMKILRALDRNLGFNVDYVRQPRLLGRPSIMLIEKSYEDNVTTFLTDNGMELDVLNVNQYLSRRRRAISDPNAVLDFNHITTKYLAFDQQMRFIRETAASVPDIARIFDVATSWEGRRIQGIRFNAARNSSNPILWIEAGVHAREWIAPSTAIYFIYQLAHNRALRQLLTQIEIVVIPNINPDGYEYSRQNDNTRMWRKTRSRHPNLKCPGVDGNRNYNFHWGQAAEDRRPCRETFAGPFANSEPEILGMSALMYREINRITGYVSLHSYGETILYPWGFKTHTYPVDVEDMRAMGREIARAIEAVSGTRYSVANSAEGLYTTFGSSDDWAKAMGIKYSFTMELSPSDRSPYEFIYPEQFIASVGKEITAGLVAMSRQLAAEYRGAPPLSKKTLRDRLRSTGSFHRSSTAANAN